MAALDVADPAVAGDVGHHLDPHPGEVFADHPDLPGQVEVAKDVDRVLGDAAGVAGADQLEHGVAGGFVAGPLVALESLGLHRQHRDTFFSRHSAADRLQVITDQADDAGGVNEGGFGAMPVDQLDQGRVELLLAAEYHVHLLQVGGKGEPVQFGAGGEGAANIPGIDCAADGAMHQMQGVGDGVEHHPRTTENAGPLADCPGQALLVAVDGKGLFPFAVDLILAFFEDG